MTTGHRLDILIVGGGLVGLGLAAALRGSALRIGLVDAQGPPAAPDKTLQARALVLTRGSVHYLKKLELWSDLSEATTPLHAVHLSKEGCLMRTRFRCADYDLDYFGQVIAADHLLHGIYQTLHENTDLSIHHHKKIKSLKRLAKGWSVLFEDESHIEAKLLVGADGTHSFVRESQGIAVEVIEDNQQALMFNILLVQDHQGVAYERWTEEGSIALLPFGDKCMKVVWMMPSGQARFLLSLESSLFLEKMQSCFGYSLGLFEAMGPVHTTPLRRLYASTVYDHHLVLIGNAANTLHPIAAQGFNMGLRDVQALAKCLAKTDRSDRTIPSDGDDGSITLLRSYAQGRSKDHLHTRQWTECLAKTAGYQGLGLWLAECVEPFKQWIVEKNAG